MRISLQVGSHLLLCHVTELCRFNEGQFVAMVGIREPIGQLHQSLDGVSALDTVVVERGRRWGGR